MSVFRYEAMKIHPEMFTETGIVRATDKNAAKDKLNQYGFDKTRVKQVRGAMAVWKWFMADIR